jgi:hypothetical protein
MAIARQNSTSPTVAKGSTGMMLRRSVERLILNSV